MRIKLLLSIFFFNFSSGQTDINVFKSFSIGTGFSIITFNRDHATQLRESPPMFVDLSYYFNRKREKNKKKYFLLGATFLLQQYTFRSYYFYPDSIRIYDKSFPIMYRLRTLTLGLNLGFKHELNNSEKYTFTPYILVHHTLFSPVLYELNFKVEQKSKLERDVAFYQTSFIGKYVNPGGLISIGLQNNMLGKKTVKLFLEAGLIASYGRFHLEKTYLASRLYFNYIILFLKTGILF